MDSLCTALTMRQSLYPVLCALVLPVLPLFVSS
jgi:hypothetical protein